MRVLWPGVALLVLSLLIAGCGIPQETYNAVLSERDKAKAQVVSVQGDLDKAKTQAASVQGDLDKAKAQVVSVQGDLDKAKAQVVSTQGDMDKARTQVKSLQDELAAAKTKYSDLDASTTKQIDALKQESAKLKRLTLYKVVFCSEKPDPTKYTAKPDATYRVGESIWVYHELIGNKYAVVDQKLQVDIESEFKVLNDKGEVVNRWVTTLKKDYDRAQSYFWYSKEYRDLKAGDYTLEIATQDKLAGETATWKGNFKVIA